MANKESITELEDIRKTIIDLSILAMRQDKQGLATKLDKCSTGINKAILILKEK